MNDFVNNESELIGFRGKVVNELTLGKRQGRAFVTIRFRDGTIFTTYQGNNGEMVWEAGDEH